MFAHCKGRAISADLRHFLETKEHGLRMLLELAAEQQGKFLPLIDYPSLIVEALVMHEDVERLANIFARLPETRNDGMLIHYAKKALEFHDGTAPSASLRTFAGDPQFDDELRKNFRYQSSPNINLAKGLFDLCKNSAKAGQACLSLCDGLSRRLSDDESSNLIIVAILQQLLFYAKFQFMKDTDEFPGGVATCETFLSLVELYESLVIAKCTFGFSLTDLADSQKSRQLRDRLIAEDRMQLAIDLAMKCNIESEPAWANWGLSLLSVGRYQEAREKFRYCLQSTGRVNANKSGAGTFNAAKLVDTEAQNARIVGEIIRTLETAPPATTDSLRSLYERLKKQTSGKSRSGRYDEMSVESYLAAMHVASPSKKQSNKDPAKHQINKQTPKLSSQRMEEAIFYLKSYAAPSTLISFLMRHGEISEACRCIFDGEMPVKVFFEQIIEFLISRDTLHLLEQYITAPSNVFSLNFMLNFCRPSACENVPARCVQAIQLAQRFQATAVHAEADAGLLACRHDLLENVSRSFRRHAREAQLP